MSSAHECAKALRVLSQTLDRTSQRCTRRAKAHVAALLLATAHATPPDHLRRHVRACTFCLFIFRFFVRVPPCFVAQSARIAFLFVYYA